tara:strand:+ start:238 stop:1644 length:1407 start_codon:yes stop_codon:yes gene_type:complete
MSDFFEVLKARGKRKDYLSRKPKKTFIHHSETGFKGTTGQYANRLMNQKFAEMGINAKDLTKEQKEDYRKKLENDILNMPHNFGLDVIDKPSKEEAPLNFVSHADGFKGTIGQRAYRMIQDGIKGGMDIPEHQKETLRQNLVLDMQQNPEKHGLTEIVGAKRSDFKKPKSTKTPQAASAPPKIAPILPKEPQQSTPDGLNMQKVMQAMKLLQDNNFPVTAESIEALLPHLPEQDSSPAQSRSNQSGNPYPTGLTPEGKFQPQRLATSFRGGEVETPAQKEKMLEYFRNNPDKRVQHRREGDESEQFLASLMNNMSAESDAETDFTQYFPSRYDEEGLAGADTRSATDDTDRPEIPDSLDPKKNKKRIENIQRKQKIFDAKSGMTEEQLMLARQKKMEADRVRARQQDASRETVMADETKPAGQMTMDDWMSRLQTSAANPTGVEPTTLNSNFDNNMFDENGNLKEEYQ